MHEAAVNLKFKDVILQNKFSSNYNGAFSKFQKDILIKDRNLKLLLFN
jgi:hypothetical protein